MSGPRKPAAQGHNSSGSGGDDFGGALLRQCFERIQRLNEEIAALNQDKSQVYSEIKANGFDLATFRSVVSRAQQDRASVVERDAMIDLYERAIFGDKPEESS